MSQSFSFPPPPPPPPRREQTVHAEIRGGFRGRGSGRGGSFRDTSHTGRGRGLYPHRGSQRGRGGPPSQSYVHGPKRDFATAFNNQPQSRPKAPPAVPSFDIDLKILLPNKSTPPETVKIKRKCNLLGLTPSDQKDSDSEVDGDEEATLAARPLGRGLNFEHGGQKLSLNTPAEIQAWIAERKKKFPTQAKADAAKREAELKKQQWEEQKRARQEALQQKKAARENERVERERQRLKEKAIAARVAQAKSAVADNKQDAANQAKAKAEKLRRKAEKAAEDLRKAEEALRQAEEDEVLQNEEAEEATVQVDSNMVHPSESTEEDDTSSSGSSDTELTTDSEPEQSTSKRVAPDKLLPEKRGNKRSNLDELPMCKSMAKFGRCKFGKKCRFSHKLPSRKKGDASNTATRRKGLYQIMVEKEQEEEMKRALRAIITLGEQGVLDDPPKAAADATQFSGQEAA